MCPADPYSDGISGRPLRRPRISDDLTNFEHGTLNGYGNRQCRCIDCRRVHAAEMKRRYELYRSQGGRGEHGTYYRYKTGCRCADCRAASATYSREYKRRQREKREQNG